MALRCVCPIHGADCPRKGVFKNQFDLQTHLNYALDRSSRNDHAPAASSKRANEDNRLDFGRNSEEDDIPALEPVMEKEETYSMSRRRRSRSDYARKSDSHRSSRRFSSESDGSELKPDKFIKLVLQGCSDAERLKQAKIGIDINQPYENYGNFTALGLAVQNNFLDTARILITDLGADVYDAGRDKLTGRDKPTPIQIASRMEKFDGTFMIQLLLMKGANPKDLPSMKELPNILRRYWKKKALTLKDPDRRDASAKLVRVDPMLKGLEELDYGIIGQHSVVQQISSAVKTFHLNHAGFEGKPLVLLIGGPPGHGKTYFSKKVGEALAKPGNFLNIPCGSIKDISEVWGSNIGGREGSEDKGTNLRYFLRPRQDEWTVVLFDEMDKPKSIEGAYHWGQAAKFFLPFLEIFQEGKMKDKKKDISCAKTIFICTMNATDNAIIEFASNHKDRLSRGIKSQADEDWIRRELVQKKLHGVLQKFFEGISPQLSPLRRRFDGVIPFLPLSDDSKLALADSVMRKIVTDLSGPPDPPRRKVGYINVRFTYRVRDRIAASYGLDVGASGPKSEALYIQQGLIRYITDPENEKKLNIESRTIKQKRGKRRISVAFYGGTQQSPAGPVYIDVDDNTKTLIFVADKSGIKEFDDGRLCESEDEDAYYGRMDEATKLSARSSTSTTFSDDEDDDAALGGYGDF